MLVIMTADSLKSCTNVAFRHKKYRRAFNYCQMVSILKDNHSINDPVSCHRANRCPLSTLYVLRCVCEIAPFHSSYKWKPNNVKVEKSTDQMESIWSCVPLAEINRGYYNKHFNVPGDILWCIESTNENSSRFK